MDEEHMKPPHEATIWNHKNYHDIHHPSSIILKAYQHDLIGYSYEYIREKRYHVSFPSIQTLANLLNMIFLIAICSIPTCESIFIQSSESCQIEWLPCMPSLEDRNTFPSIWLILEWKDVLEQSELPHQIFKSQPYWVCLLLNGSVSLAMNLA